MFVKKYKTSYILTFYELFVDIIILDTLRFARYQPSSFYREKHINFERKNKILNEITRKHRIVFVTLHHNSNNNNNDATKQSKQNQIAGEFTNHSQLRQAGKNLPAKYKDEKYLIQIEPSKGKVIINR